MRKGVGKSHLSRPSFARSQVTKQRKKKETTLKQPFSLSPSRWRRTMQNFEAELASEMEALEARYRGYLPSRLSGFYLTSYSHLDFSFSSSSNSKSGRNSPSSPASHSRRRVSPHSTPSSPSPFSIPRVSLRLGTSETSSVISSSGGTLPRSYSSRNNKPDLLPSSPRS